MLTLRMRFLSVTVPLTMCGCGTYSMVSSSDTLPSGNVELASGFAVSTLPEVNPVIHGAIGISKRVELDAHYEMLSGFGELRFGILHNQRNGIGVALGVGAGQATTLVNEVSKSKDGFAVTASAAIGKKIGGLELAVGHRTFVLDGGNFMASSTRAQVRYTFHRVGVFAEAGATVHYAAAAAAAALVVGEGAFGFTLHIR
jgi:hypothetical protein